MNQGLAVQLGARGRSAVGRTVYAGLVRGPIAGVVGDLRHSQLDTRSVRQIYIAYRKMPVIGTVRVRIRLAGEPDALAPAIRHRVSAIDANVPVHRLQTLEQDLYDSLAPRRFQFHLLASFAALALLLALVGVYGVIAFIVAQRTRETGFRVALGARRGRIVWMVARYGTAIAAARLAAGLAGALAHVDSWRR